MSITVYSTPSCVQCKATYRALDKKGLAYEVVDVTQDAQALATVQALGYVQAPVVVVGDEHWSGFRPDRISAVAERFAALTV
ncbi:glutaredoxin-like protein NrdH [Kineococcus rubinsiae]|uniref:glutaredoxin-like protein NrdH n=1 Tax=Kineococcus rubinsiae TaxID=2609562 RepID=UPI00142F6F40|nr:glutaredoxin-like protein NrdH [Kineococcus rubinsiae]NIZ90857.1 glutaredoxin-like protein NrdH [Kineococcus rubinsiae]